MQFKGDSVQECTDDFIDTDRFNINGAVVTKPLLNNGQIKKINENISN